MATAAVPFLINQRVTIGTNTAGIPVGTGFCVGCYNNPGSTGLAWIVKVSVLDDRFGRHVYHVPAAVVTATSP